MIYLSQPNAGSLLLTRQLFSERVSNIAAAVPGGRFSNPPPAAILERQSVKTL